MRGAWIFVGLFLLLGFVLLTAATLHNARTTSEEDSRPEFSSSALYQVDVDLNGVDGHVAAFGDFDSDKYTDLFIVNVNRSAVSVYVWSSAHYSFIQLLASKITLENAKIINVVPGDFNRDGCLDLLVESSIPISSPAESSEERKKNRASSAPHPTTPLQTGVHLSLYLGDHSVFGERPVWEETVAEQVLMFDYDMDGWPDLLTRSFHSTGTAGERVVWRNEKSDMVSFTLINTPFLAPRTLPTSPSSGVFVREKEEEMEQSRSVQREIARESEEEESGDWGEYSIPSSNAFVDMNGDCLADLFLTSFRCKEIVVKSSGKSSSATTLVECEKVVELLLNNKDGLLARGEQPYVHHSEYTMTRLYYTSEMWGKLERGQSLGRDGGAQLSFADVDGDGAMDVIMPVCISSIEGVISNQGDCAVESSIHIIYNSQTMLCGVVTGELNCRKEEDLCSPDPHFTLGSFNGTQSTADVVIIPRALMGDYHLLSRKDMEPLTVRVGDYNLDGFPDILIPLVKEKAVASAPTPNLVRSSVSNQKHVLLSIQEEQRQESFLISQNMSHGLEYAKATGQSAHHGAGSYLDMTPRSPTVDSLLREDEVLEGQIVMTLWRNVPCTDQLCGEEADDRGRRTFVRVLGSEVDALHRVRNPFTAVFFDLDETGSADIIVLSDQLLSHSSKKPMKGSKEEAKDLRATKGRSVAVLYNNLYNDAFFLKALGLSGLCTAWCPGVTRFPDPKPYGVNFPGGVFKFTVTDLLGVKRVSMSSQLAQSSHLSLQLPYTLFGLGRAGNYIELIFYGIPYQASRHWNSWICIIPNSQLVAIPYELGKSTNWQLELYITPSGITVAVLLCMIGSLLLLGLIIYILRWREKLQDEMEKREKAHLFSFDAL